MKRIWVTYYGRKKESDSPFDKGLLSLAADTMSEARKKAVRILEKRGLEVKFDDFETKCRYCLDCVEDEYGTDICMIARKPIIDVHDCQDSIVSTGEYDDTEETKKGKKK